MTTNESILPDALRLQAHDRHHGRPESYWQERNALVDAVRAASPGRHIAEDRQWVAYDERTPEEQATWDAYGQAIDALRAFDDASDGSPVL